jgi:hypothetical protein
MDRRHLKVQDGKVYILGRGTRVPKSPDGRILTEYALNAYLVIVSLDGKLLGTIPLDGKVLEAKFSGTVADEIVVWKKRTVEKYVIREGEPANPSDSESETLS